MRSTILDMGMVKTIIAVSIVAACGTVKDDTLPSQPDGHGEFSEHQGMESQGRTLLGKFVDAFGPTMPDHASVLADGTDADGNAITIELTGGASLRSGDHVGFDPFFSGVILHVDQGGELMLEPSRGGTDLAFYKLQYRATPSDPWTDPCFDPDGNTFDDAVPYAGTWSRAGLHSTTPGRISFACDRGVAYKCATWGFLAGGDDSSLAFRANQACTRMARADYCANGHSHTREGTLIRIFDVAGVIGPPTVDDLKGVVHWAPNAANYFFEAAWNSGDQPVSCLSRLRWQSLPILGEDGDGNACPDAIVHDPRTSAATFCEDMQFTGTDGPLLFNASTYNDL
ncbi:MAG TPA: ADYC domain-containing protein, partial [Kofleriaceae bacterium]|nr:ADYC domain-containing protein [Kofleriaceae bacterium]